MSQTIDNNLEDKVKVFPSSVLSEKLGLDISIMDFEHKKLKARDAFDYAEEAGYEVVVAITSGNYGGALDLESISRNVQPVSFTGNMEEPMELIELGNGRYGVRFRLPDKWFTSKQLEKYWKKIAKGSRLSRKNIREIIACPEYRQFMKSLAKREINPRKVKAVTNFCDWPNKDPYYIPEVRDVLRNNNTVILPNGSSELLLTFLKANNSLWWWNKARIIACTSPANIFADSYVFDGIIEEGSEADKLDLLRPGEANWMARALANKRTYFATIPRTQTFAGYGVYKSHVKEENSGINASLTSAICAGALLYAHDNGMELPNTYRFEHLDKYSNFLVDKRGLNIWKKYPVYRKCSFKPGEKVCIVNTGGE